MKILQADIADVLEDAAFSIHKDTVYAVYDYFNCLSIPAADTLNNMTDNLYVAVRSHQNEFYEDQPNRG